MLRQAIPLSPFDEELVIILLANKFESTDLASSLQLDAINPLAGVGKLLSHACPN